MKSGIEVMAIIHIGFFLLCLNTAEALAFTHVELQGIYESLNVSTFRSSLMPRRTKDDIYLSEMGLEQPNYFDNGFSVDGKDWVYTFTIIEKTDKNRDDVVDYVICFSDKSKVGTYDVTQSMLISPLGVNGQYVALAFTVDGC